MARRMQNLEAYFAQFEFFTIFCYMNRETGFGLRTINNRCTRCLAQVKVATDKISMEMGFKNIFDRCLTFVSQLKVNVDISKGIYNSGYAFTFNVVCSFTKAACI